MEGGHPGGPGEPVAQPATALRSPMRRRGGRGRGWYALFTSYLTHPPLCNGPIRKMRKDR